MCRSLGLSDERMSANHFAAVELSGSVRMTSVKEMFVGKDFRENLCSFLDSRITLK